jgi:quinol monooxygenase YgiN
MAHMHDPIVTRCGQRQTYESCATAVLRGVFRMPGEAGRLEDAFASARLIRVADCRVRPERREHFVDAQLTVWAPGMAKAPGMLGGIFTVSATDPTRFLVLTGWANAAAHAAYAKDRVPALRALATLDEDVLTLEGRRVAVEPSWLVSPASPPARSRRS